jgi:hypothetical protein
MNLLARIIKEERRLEKRLLELQRQLENARAAARALGHKPKARRGELSLAARRKIAKSTASSVGSVESSSKDGESRVGEVYRAVPRKFPFTEWLLYSSETAPNLDTK